jgi:hypothetical protein
LSNPRQGVFDKTHARELGSQLPPQGGGAERSKCPVAFYTLPNHTRLVPLVALVRAIALRCTLSRVPGKIRPFSARGAGAPTPGAPTPAKSEPPPAVAHSISHPPTLGIATLSDKSPRMSPCSPNLRPPETGGSQICGSRDALSNAHRRLTLQPTRHFSHA